MRASSVLSLSLFILFLGNINAQGFKKDDYTINKRVYGPFSVGDKNKQTILVEVERIYFSSNLNFQWGESDISVTFRDSTGKIIFRRNYTADGESERNIEFEQVFIPTIGNTILLMKSSVPSYGAWIDGQYFGLNVLGQIVPISSIMRSYEYRTGFDFFKPTLDRPDQPKGTTSKPLIQVLEWTDCFNVVNYYPLHFYADDRHPSYLPRMDKVPVVIDEVRAKENRRSYEVMEFYKKPSNTEEDKQFITINPQSEVAFIDAVRNFDDVWLHVKIDGIEGYVIGRESCRKLGLPQVN